jgi:hypothetical protein
MATTARMTTMMAATATAAADDNAMAVTEELGALNVLAVVASEASETAGFHKGGA